jgi:hypothetical protein
MDFRWNWFGIVPEDLFLVGCVEISGSMVTVEAYVNILLS